MKIYKIGFVVLFSGAFHWLCSAQTIQEPVHGLRDVSERWRISLFAGLPMMGPGEDIETNMRNSGLGDFRSWDQIWIWPIPDKQFPDRKSGLIWNVKMQYRMTNSSAVNFVYGTSSKSKVEGYDEIDHIGGIENYLTIKSITKYGAIHYVWNFGREEDGINVSVGPLLADQKIYLTYDNNPENKTSTPLKIGVDLGFSWAFIQGNSWFMTFDANYTWLPKNEIGPYTVMNSIAGDEYQSVFRKTKVNLSNINIGLGTGWRF